MKEMNSMIELQDVFKCFGEQYINSHNIHLDGLKAINSITQCRTAALGGHADVCDSCGSYKIAYNPCNNRNCPKCGNLKKEHWILDRQSELLPVRYFHTVFTVPHQLNSLFLSNTKVMNSILFKAASETLVNLALDKKYLGAKIGLTMVLHTWGQTLSFHPHVHCIVPGGGLSQSGITFIKSKKKFFIPVKVLSKVFKGKFLDFVINSLDSKELKLPSNLSKTQFDTLKNELYSIDWVVYCKKPFKETSNIVEYLSRYTHKTAIYNERIKSMDNSSVTFRYRDYRDNTVKFMTLTSAEFIRRFLIHVLPAGFQRIRYYGLLSNRMRNKNLAKCFKLLKIPITTKKKYTPKELMLKVMGLDISICPHCGGNWITISSILPNTG